MWRCIVEWIRVEDKLPEKGVDVLLTNGIDVYFGFIGFDVEPVWTNRYGEWYRFVTHWMPLPEPPK